MRGRATWFFSCTTNLQRAFEPAANLQGPAEREADDLRLVLAIFAQGEAKVDRQGEPVAAQRQDDSDPDPHARANCTDLQVPLNRAGIKEGHPADQLPDQRDVELGGARE